IVPENEKELWAKYGKPLRTYGNRVQVIGDIEFGKPLKVSVDYDGKHDIELPGTYLALQYLDAMSMALEFCAEMKIPAETVLSALVTFNGVPGRGEISYENGVSYLRERNPGISHMSVERTLSCLQRMNALENSILIIDPVSKKVCDKMDKDLIGAVAEKYGVPLMITDGTGKEPEVPAGKTTVIRMIKEGYQ
ncbi:MAG: coenzyme F430 synthase, partial [archaeon]|nr:coenzyme F430 synthase [archaeon]